MEAFLLPREGAACVYIVCGKTLAVAYKKEETDPGRIRLFRENMIATRGREKSVEITNISLSLTIWLMTGIDLSSNSLSGEIPAEVLSLQEIRFLNLSRNNLSGGIPNNIDTIYGVP